MSEQIAEILEILVRGYLVVLGYLVVGTPLAPV